MGLLIIHMASPPVTSAPAHLGLTALTGGPSPRQVGPERTALQVNALEVQAQGGAPL